MSIVFKLTTLMVAGSKLVKLAEQNPATINKIFFKLLINLLYNVVD